MLWSLEIEVKSLPVYMSQRELRLPVDMEFRTIPDFG